MSATVSKKIKTVSLLLCLLVTGGLLVGGIWVYKKFDNVKSELSDFILSNPESTGVAAYTFDENGELVADEQAIFYNADEPLVVASVMKTVVLAAYADAVSKGDLDPGEKISIRDVEKYYLPMTDGGAHSKGLQSAGIETDEYGFARDRAASVTLDELARIMIHESGNAETDYLIERLGAERISSVMHQVGLEHHTPIGFTLGYALATFNHENPSFSTVQIQTVVDRVSGGDTGPLDRPVDLYLHNREWRAAQIEFMSSIKDLAVSGAEMWSFQTTASQLLPKGTAREYAQMMAKIARGKLISPAISKLMQEKLETVESDWPLRALFFDRFGAKDGTTSGVLAVASYAIPKRGLLQNQSRVVVIITTRLPLEKWTDQVQYQGHYLLPLDLVQATGVFNSFAGAGKK